MSSRHQHQPDPTPSQTAAGSPPATDRFAWHPRYKGKTAAEVRREIEQELGTDQRAYGLVLEGADRQENAALASVIELERKWGGFDMNWAEADPTDLAGRIAAFEQTRDQRREMIPAASFRASVSPAPDPSRRASSGAPPGIGVAGGRPPMLWLAIAAALLLLLVLYLVL